MRTSLVGVGLLAVASCSDQQYLGEGGFYTFAMSEDTLPFVESEDGEDGDTLFLIEQRIELPLRAPTDAQLAELATGAEGLPWARRPWVQRHDYELEIDWVILNLDDQRRNIALTFNGINEFHEYMPGVTEEGEVVPDFAQWERTMVLEPLERRYGTIREEHFDEIAVDLATVVNGVTNANLIVHPDNHSAIDPRAIPFVPTVVPALVGVRAGLRSGSTSNVVVELTVRVRDERGIVIEDDQRAWELPVPEAFLPSSLNASEE